MPTSRWSAVRFNVDVMVAGVSFEAVQVVCSYEQNAIPTCSITVAVGRNVATLEHATAHDELRHLKNRSFVEVYLKVTPLQSEGGAPHEWPKDRFPIFMGFVTGTGWQRSNTGANFVIHVEHWLSELNYTSAINGASHPANPAAFTFPAGFRAPVVGTGGGTDVNWVYHLRLRDGVTKEMAEDDLWERVLKPWSLQVAEERPTDDRLLFGIETPMGNDAAVDILRGDKAFKIVSNGYMGMQLNGPNSLAMGNALARALENSMGNNVINTTLWGKMIGEWSVDYWFIVVPRVMDALVVPFVGALSGPPWVEIKAGDYVQCDLQAAVPQQLSCVCLLHAVTWLAAGNTNLGEFDEIKGGLAGLYPIPPKKKGVMLYKDVPRWLTDVLQEYDQGLEAEGVYPRLPIRTGADADDVGTAGVDELSPNKFQDQFRDVIARYAQHWYLLEQLKGRTGELAGRLRFDIAPGSQVRVLSHGGPGGAADDLTEPFYGSVSKVTHLINAEMQRAGTSFTLAHIRNERENGDSDYSIDVPPLYKKAWRGDVLVDGFNPGR